MARARSKALLNVGVRGLRAQPRRIRSSSSQPCHQSSAVLAISEFLEADRTKARVAHLLVAHPEVNVYPDESEPSARHKDGSTVF